MGGDDADEGGGGGDDGGADRTRTARRCTGSVHENHRGMAGLRSPNCGVAASYILPDLKVL